MERVIFHIDMNNFFASVEGIGRPELKGVPYAVCGDPMLRHGIVLAKNPVAKEYGVKTGEPIFSAKQKCPSLKILPPHYEKYRAISAEARKIYESYTDRVESFGIDECWCDMSGIGMDEGMTLADEIRHRISAELGVTASVGVSFNKIFAKLGSDYRKPDATTVITKENFRELVWKLPVTDMLFVGPSVAARLSRYSIYTIGDVARGERSFFALILGKNGELLYDRANGIDHSSVLRADEAPPPKSISRSTTPPRDLTSTEALKALSLSISDVLAEELRAFDMQCSVVAVFIRDPSLRTLVRQRKLLHPTCLSRDISQTAMALVKENYSDGEAVRAFGIQVSELSRFSGSQITFDICGTTERRERLEKALFSIRGRYGGRVIKTALEAKNGGLAEIDRLGGSPFR